MSFIEALFDLTILGIARMLMYVGIGTVVGIFLLPLLMAKNRIFYCRERDRRGHELKFSKEGPVFITTQSKPPFQFIKWGGAYEFAGRLKRKFTTFFAKEGTAYTWVLKGFNMVDSGETETKMFERTDEEGNPVFDANGMVILEEREVPKMVPQKHEIPFGTLEDAVIYRWGTQFYKTVPDERKKALMDDKVHVTVELEPGFIPEGYAKITEQDINTEGDKNMLRLWATEAKGALKGSLANIVLAIGCGAGLTFIGCLAMGWIPLAGVGG